MAISFVRQDFAFRKSMLLISSQSLCCPFQASVLSGATCSSVPAFCHLGLISCSLGWTILELEGGDIWKEEVIPLVSRTISHGFLQEDPCTGQSLLPWSPELWFYCLPCSLRSRSWTPPSHGLCSQCLPLKHLHSSKDLFCLYHIQQSTSPISISSSMPISLHCNTPVVWAIPPHLCDPNCICPAPACRTLVPPVCFPWCISVQKLQINIQSCWFPRKIMRVSPSAILLGLLYLCAYTWGSTPSSL